MGPSQKLLWKIYAGILGAVATFAAQKLVTTAWRGVTGKEPPTPTDPDTPMVEAASWAVASALGVGVTQLVTQRLASRRWSKEMGSKPPSPKQIKVKV